MRLVAPDGIKEPGMSKILPSRLAIACCIVASSLLAVAAHAEEGVAFKNLMGSIGIIPKEKDAIQYRERAPLVLPPKSTLPVPKSGDLAANPQWPNDPDVAERRRRRDEERRPVTFSETRRMQDNNPILRPDELQRGRVASSAPSIPGSHRGENARDVLYLSPDQMKAGKKADADEDDKKPAAEPSRGVLSDPPTGYRRQTRPAAKADASAPRVIDQQAIDASPMAWLTQKFRSDSDDE